MKVFGKLTIGCIAAVMVALLIAGAAGANTTRMFMKIGRLWGCFEFDLAEGWNREWAWPGGHLYPRTGTECWDANYLKVGVQTGVRDWTAPNGEYYTYFTSGAFRSFSHDYVDWPDPYPVKSLIFPVEQHALQRFPPPRVVVNGKDVVLEWGPNFKPSLINQDIDPNLIAERVCYMTVRFGLGVEYQRAAYAYPAPPDWDYIVWAIDLINNGNADCDDDIELPGQSLKGFWFAQTGHPKVSHLGETKGFGGGRDDIGEFIAPFGEDNHQFYLAYDGDWDGNPLVDWGDCGPTSNDADDAWIMESPAYIAHGAVWASTPGALGVDDPSQPRCTALCDYKNYELGKKPKTFQDQYEILFSEGTKIPLDTPSNVIDPSIHDSPTGYLSYGPYDLGPDEAVHLDYIWAAGGISRADCFRMGDEIHERRITGQGDMTDDEINYIKTGRDSVLKVLARAYWNIHGVYPPGYEYLGNPKPAQYNQKYNVPEAPVPPSYFSVSVFGNKVKLQWTREPENTPDFDTGVNDFAGYRIYRAVGLRDSLYHMIAEGPASAFTSTKITTPEGEELDGLEYVDEDVTIGVSYYYRLVAYDDGSQNWADPGVSLESGHFYCWQGWGPEAAVPVKEAAKNLANIRVVPNPYSSTGKTYVGEPDKIIFKNIPGICTIRIYTSAGDLVKVIEHTDGSGDQAWDLRTDFNQYLKSDLYVFTVESKDPNVSGNYVGKFIVVR